MKERHLFWLLFCLLAVSLFVNIGINPLFMEEPRRAMIGLEMFLQKNLLVPTQYGAFYYRKPPVFNWVVLGMMRVFPQHPEFACRTVSVISFLLMGWLTYIFGRKFYSEKLGRMAALLFLTSAHLLFYGSMFAEIDLFYSLLTYSFILCLFLFLRSDSKLSYFLVAYYLSSIGVLTKGAPSLLFLGISLTVHLYYTRKLKWLISWQHLLSILMFCAMVGGFAWGYSQFNPLDKLVSGIWHQASERTIAGTGIWCGLKHLVSYPFEVFTDLLPITLFVPFLFFTGVLAKMLKHQYLKFVLLMFASNMLVYWVSPGTRSRYVYMLYPLAVTICTWLYLEHGSRFRLPASVLRYFNLSVIVLLTLVLVALPFAAHLIGIDDFPVLVTVLSLPVLGILLFATWKNVFSEQLWWTIALLIIVRLQFDLVVLPQRAATGEHAAYKVHGEQIASITKGAHLWLYRYNLSDESSLKFGHGFYIEWNRQEVLRPKDEPNCTDYFLAMDYQLPEHSYDTYYAFDRREKHWLLVKFKDCDR